MVVNCAELSCVRSSAEESIVSEKMYTSEPVDKKYNIGKHRMFHMVDYYDCTLSLKTVGPW